MAKLAAPKPPVRLAYERFMAEAMPMRRWINAPEFVLQEETWPDFEGMSIAEIDKWMTEETAKMVEIEEATMSQTIKGCRAMHSRGK